MEEKITIQEINEALEICEPFEKAVIKLMLTSGMNVRQIIELDYDDFILSIIEYFDGKGIDQFDISEIFEELDLKNAVLTWMIESKKGYNYVTFSDTETTSTILCYLYYRENIAEAVEVDALFTTNTGRRISREDISEIFQKMSEKLGKNIKPVHLRQLFTQTLLQNGASKSVVSIMLGHEIDPSELEDKKILEYFEWDVFLKKTYIKHMQCFSTNNGTSEQTFFEIADERGSK